MATYSEKTTFYGYEDPDGNLATCLYEGQGAATSDLNERFERGTDIKFADFENAGTTYTQRWKAYRKAVREAAKKEVAKAGYKLVTYKLVRNE